MFVGPLGRSANPIPNPPRTRQRVEHINHHARQTRCRQARSPRSIAARSPHCVDERGGIGASEAAAQGMFRISESGAHIPVRPANPNLALSPRPYSTRHGSQLQKKLNMSPCSRSRCGIGPPYPITVTAEANIQPWPQLLRTAIEKEGSQKLLKRSEYWL